MTALLNILKNVACNDRRTKSIAIKLMLNVHGVAELLTTLCYAVPSVAELLDIPKVSVKSHFAKKSGDTLLVLNQQGSPQTVATDRFIGVVTITKLSGDTLRVLNSENNTLVPYAIEDGRIVANWPAWSGITGSLLDDVSWSVGDSVELSVAKVYPYAEKQKQLLQDGDTFDFLAKYGYVEAIFQQGDPREAVAIAVYSIYKALS